MRTTPYRYCPTARLGFLNMVLLAPVCAAAALAPRVIETRFPTDDIVIAMAVVTEEPFGAQSDGTADCTPAIQNAIDAVEKAGGGVVFLPAGRYLCRGNLHVKSAVTLRGDWNSPEQNPRVQGTILMPTAGRGQEQGPPFIAMGCGSGIRNLSIWYPDQQPDAIVPYPWTVQIDTRRGAENRTIHHVTLVNSYQGFRFGPHGDELHTLRDVYGTPLFRGIRLDRTTDIGRLIHVRFGADWWLRSGLMAHTEEREQALRQFLRAHGTALFIDRSDWEYAFDLRFRGYARGIHVKGFTNAVFYDVEISGGAVALQADELNHVGLALTNCRLDGSVAGVLGRFRSVCQFNNCTLGGEARTAALLEGSGNASFVNGAFAGWKDAGVDATQGSVSILGCAFKQAGTAIRLGPGVQRAHVLGNSFAGTPEIDVRSQGDVRVLHDLPTFRKPSTEPIDLPPDPRPASAELFNVSDHGAVPDAVTDNTKAFQAALDAARKAGGGTVFVPGGNYRFEGTLAVPTGVELRGCFDVPHHTRSGGSTLMPVGGRGQEEGPPFIVLAPKSGLRGFTVWYPEQHIRNVTPYPWAVRGAGPGCWILDVCLSNPYQGVDFATHPSDGHLLRYLCGAPMRCGLRVDKGSGVVECCHFNPHYWGRRPAGHPAPEGLAGGEALIQPAIRYMQGHLDGLVFGDCPKTLQVNNFVLGCRHGLRFAGRAAGSSGRVIQHGSDASTYGVAIEKAGNLELVNTQMVSPGAALLVTEPFAGKAAMFNALSWGGRARYTASLAGKGDVLLQQWHCTRTVAPVDVRSGRADIEAFHFDRGGTLARADKGVEKLTLTGNAAAGDHDFVFTPGPAVTGFCNGLGRRPAPMPSAGLAANEPAPQGADWRDRRPHGQDVPAAAGAHSIRAVPDGGLHAAPLSVLLETVPKDLALRYTLDGSPPGMTSALYAQPILLDQAGHYELRFQPFDAEGNPAGAMESRLFGVK
ncbi:MAG: chitobiase/beta-hexosaminidase C-terminal domain-containing protein [Kiritimatiellae bacterium]|nr:chitobiase/beta-hexosaminidase C-terminal domain-containing protein [Kiritimatiellia bacterium]